MATMAQHRARQDMENAMDRVQEDLRLKWIAGSLPDEWNGMDSFGGVAPHKTRVTVRLDADMVKWFRTLGPNYSQRMNDVLRVYWKALLSGHIKAYYADDPAPRMMLQMQADLDRMAQARKERAGG